ncbi:MAG: tryptophan 7-halogenase [Myxococcales bacterium]|nr:tryptophan 7-halogenase [Myxococcales bacterium]
MQGEAHEERFDVVIGGGGLAGLTLARQLRRELPEARVAVVEKQRRPLPVAAWKVGESSVELGSHYFGVVLGLGDYLRKWHYIKNGLRFYPGGGDTLPLAMRTEIGPPALPPVPSFQLDRGRLEEDLRAMNEADGVTMLEGWQIKDVELDEGEADHVVTIQETGGEAARTLRAGYYVDASGRRGFLRHKLGLAGKSPHTANAAWWRVKGRVDVADLVPQEDTAWHARDPEHVRWYSTTHFMGTGYWFWYIPLAAGPDGQDHTSLGIVVHDEVHPFDTIRTLDRALAWVERFEPVCYAQIKDLPAEDFLCLKGYSHECKRCFWPRFSLVGEAGKFSDPLYSPGSDFIALANTYTAEIIKARLRGGDVEQLVARYERSYTGFFNNVIEIYKGAAPVLGSPRVMAAKLYWDDYVYWSMVCQYFFQRLFAAPEERHLEFETLAMRLGDMQKRAQLLMREWALRYGDEPQPIHVKLPLLSSLLANAHLDLQKVMTIDETLAYIRDRCERTAEMLDDLVVRALASLGPAGARELAAALDLPSWPRRSFRERLAAEALEGGTRRRHLPPIVRDMERMLGRMEVHPESEPLATMLARAFGDPPLAPASAAVDSPPASAAV